MPPYPPKILKRLRRVSFQLHIFLCNPLSSLEINWHLVKCKKEANQIKSFSRMKSLRMFNLYLRSQIENGMCSLFKTQNLVKDKYSDNISMSHGGRYDIVTHAKTYKNASPSREKLLPEPLTEPYYQPPFTLLIELTGVLVHPDWTFGTGWRFKKRPGVEFFLQQVGPPLFEVVIFTNEQAFTAFPIIDSLDPNGYVMYRLFRDATRYNKSGHHVKDLSCLNRDLSKVIMVDCNANSVELNLENSIVLKKWNGEDQDRGLIDLAIFLRTIVGNEVEDVRPILEYYSQFDDPIAVFKEKQRQLAELNNGEYCVYENN
ncbi:Mitochondrial import inner membrane translocase subunit TIM50 [Nymphon striatum]|nr:Mitochondrial import inner membrane translocase subunit TIM50 [Nymphon striatum]